MSTVIQINSPVIINWMKHVFMRDLNDDDSWAQMTSATIVSERERRNWAITKDFITVCGASKKKHGEWAGDSGVVVWWLSLW